MIDFEKFLDWAESRFDNIVVSGDEVKVDSIFCEDHKQKMWCNPYGGKKAADLLVNLQEHNLKSYLSRNCSFFEQSLCLFYRPNLSRL